MAHKVPDRNLKFYSMNSCVIQEIEGLTYCSGEAALADFCQQNLEQQQTKFKTLAAVPQKLYSHYVFCAGVSRNENSESNYGARFAKALRDNKLGVVVEAPVKENEAYHPGRYGQAWLWCPDTEALLVWWGKWKENNQLPEEKKTVPPPEPQMANVAQAVKAEPLGNAVYAGNIPVAQNKQVDIGPDQARAVYEWYERHKIAVEEQQQVQAERKRRAEGPYYYRGIKMNGGA